MLFQKKWLSLRSFTLAVFLCFLMAELAFIGTSIKNGQPRFIPYNFCNQESAKESLAIIMPINEISDMQFYRNMWVDDYLHTVCDFEGPECTLSCNNKHTYATLDEKTICFVNQLKKDYKDTNFFIKLDDDAMVDKRYVMELIEKYRDYKDPVYISKFDRYWDPQKAFNGSYFGDGKFYMFNRALVDCINTKYDYRGPSPEDVVFGAMVADGCGTKVVKVADDESKIWHKKYQNKNKYINLSALANH